MNRIISYCLAGLLVLAVIAGCDDTPRGADGYRFGSKEFSRDRVDLSVVEYSSLEALQTEARARGIGHWRQVQAFATFGRDSATCTIHIVDPARRYAPEFIGHEIAHCLYGRWHAEDE